MNHQLHEKNWKHSLTIIRTIENAKINGRKIKILCRNSYWRRFVHEKAKELNIPSRSILMYENPHINSKINNYRNSGCCSDCDGVGVKFTLTPQSFVELNNGYKKQLIGNDNILNYFNRSSRKTRCYLSNWGWSDWNLINLKDKFIKNYRNDLKKTEEQLEEIIIILEQINRKFGLFSYSFHQIYKYIYKLYIYKL